jgi:hypothetical protein
MGYTEVAFTKFGAPASLIDHPSHHDVIDELHVYARALTIAVRCERFAISKRVPSDTMASNVVVCGCPRDHLRLCTEKKSQIICNVQERRMPVDIQDVSMTTSRHQIAPLSSIKERHANVSRRTITTNIMDKTTSVLAAFEAGKLPSTQQFNKFIDWLNDVGIAKLEPTSNTELSSQGRVLANDLRHVLESYKTLGSDKNCPFSYSSLRYSHIIPLILRMQPIMSCRKPSGT